MKQREPDMERVEFWAKLYVKAEGPEEREMVRKIAEDSGEQIEANLGLLRSTNPERIGRV